MRVLITGASRGIGLALTKELSGRGALVMATAREPEHAAELNEAAKGSEGRVNVHVLNVCQDDSVTGCARAVAQEWPALDVLVNNAALFPEEGDEPFEAIRPEWFGQAMATNVEGVARVTQAFLPLLRAGKNPRLVNISSGAASISTRTEARYFCYAASKAALNSLTRGLAAQYREEGIIVVPISPGWVQTQMGGPNAKITPEESASSLATTIENLSMEQTGEFLDRFGETGNYQW